MNVCNIWTFILYTFFPGMFEDGRWCMWNHNYRKLEDRSILTAASAGFIERAVSKLLEARLSGTLLWSKLLQRSKKHLCKFRYWRAHCMIALQNPTPVLMSASHTLALSLAEVNEVWEVLHKSPASSPKRKLHTAG